MLMPKRTKHRKQHRGRMKGIAKGARELNFGDYGLVALEPCWLTNRQMEAARVAIVRYLRRGGKTWFRVFPDKPYTKRPAETRMGSGKGSVEGWVAVVKRGRVIMELGGVSESLAMEALRRASQKLPIKVKIISRAAQTSHKEHAPDVELSAGAEPETMTPVVETAKESPAVETAPVEEPAAVEETATETETEEAAPEAAEEQPETPAEATAGEAATTEEETTAQEEGTDETDKS
jgi:large subunit ribosomal protein L16